MPVAERAKQFMPFAAVRGLNTALRRKEQELGQAPPKIIAEEAAAELDGKLRQLQKGRQVRVTYFSHGRYVQSSGSVLALDEVRRRLTLAGAADNSGLAEAADKLAIALADIIALDFD